MIFVEIEITQRITLVLTDHNYYWDFKNLRNMYSISLLSEYHPCYTRCPMKLINTIHIQIRSYCLQYNSTCSLFILPMLAP